jgi:hypothetical protein
LKIHAPRGLVVNGVRLESEIAVTLSLPVRALGSKIGSRVALP